MDKIVKTNALRILDKQKIPYRIHTYEWSEDKTGGIHVMEELKEIADWIFKTIVLTGKSRQLYVCIIHAEAHLDLKKVTKVCGEKNIELLPLPELEKQTGYIRGGCSPIGMKKKFPTFLDTAAEKFDRIVVSAGKRGLQVEINVKDLLIVTDSKLKKLTTD